MAASNGRLPIRLAITHDPDAVLPDRDERDQSGMKRVIVGMRQDNSTLAPAACPGRSVPRSPPSSYDLRLADRSFARR